MDGNTDNAVSWGVSGGALTIDGDLTLNRLAATGIVVIATNTDTSNKPLIMTEDKNLAAVIYLQWKERIRLIP